MIDYSKVQFQPGMYYQEYPFTFTVTHRNNKSVTFTEVWRAEDSGRMCKCTHKYLLGKDEDTGNEYAVTESGRKIYANAMFNLNEFYPEDKTEDIEEKTEYTPSATNGDYSPSNPWDAPGMSIRDFL